ncbi:MAG: glycerophosphodiester phosphodiesterase [Planctomycetota bacterium]
MDGASFDPRDHPFFRALRTLPRPVIVAHRGWSARFPENTLSAFDAAAGAGAEMLEFDVHETADGHCVCIHDETLDRTTDAVARYGRDSIAVASTTLAEIRELDAGSWFEPRFAGERVPTLGSVLDRHAPQLLLMLEHKGGTVTNLLEELESHPARHRVMVQSFDLDFVAECRTRAPWLALGALGEGRLDHDRWRRITELGVGLIHWNVHDLRSSDLSMIRGAELLSCVYTANSDVEWMGCSSMGITAVTTNHPDRYAELRRRG